ncbi:hypothetical protein FI615_001701 [Enterococcus faecium]|uniref:hypothetical protein n=1 Tax=Enterococcus faecium TaxID=1352 RepID=UPI001922622B|nr:hypothetical protein [Enterococcus faecium]EGP4894214.1 hypothetical protein [Enterococcus faecium]EHK9936770.1 hypothetical protein [Enterococcus faecium]MBL3708362.1 hypothetical protein [Enterococcus faecium]
MEELLEFLTQFHKNAPPFIRVNNDGSYSLVGSSDLVNGSNHQYGELGKCKLTAKNHTKTLISLINFLVLADALVDEGFAVKDREVIELLEVSFSEVLSAYFGKKVDYSQFLALQFVNNNKQLVNEALYNVTKDKEIEKPRDYQSIVDGLEGQQFSDPYLNIAYEIAQEYRLRPYEIVENWSTSELIVAFAKIANDRSLESFLNWKYSQPNAPKRNPPKKQVLFFEEIDDREEGKEDE